MIRELENRSSETGYEYCAQVAAHLKMVANTSVRNVGSLAGNLVLKKAHPEFASDVFVLLAAVGASIWVRDSVGWEKYTASEFLVLDMDRKVINWIEFPQFAASVKFASFKITPRRQGCNSIEKCCFDIWLKYQIENPLILRLRHPFFQPTYSHGRKSQAKTLVIFQAR